MKTHTRKSLRLGTTFEYDLVDSFGNVVLPANRYISPELLHHLESIECTHVFSAPPQDESSEVSGSYADSATQLPPDYDSSHQRTLDALLEDAPEIISLLAEQFNAGGPIDTNAVNFLVESYDRLVDSDPDIVLSNMLALDAGDVQASLRSLRMSALVMVCAYQLGFSSEDRILVGRAALLHDVSLPVNWPALLALQAAAPYKMHDLLHNFSQHPFRSADLLKRNFYGISDLELTLVAQVHEQCDGSGFPRGLKQHLLHPLSRLLNLVDAFLTLTDDAHPSGGYMASDALAYLVLHTLYGSFDRDCIQALIRSAAVYPIGSEVRLDDETIATVLRSGKEDYCRPIVRLHTPGAERVDLRRSKRKIVEPAQPSGTRLPKSHLHRNLWQTL